MLSSRDQSHFDPLRSSPEGAFLLFRLVSLALLVSLIGLVLGVVFDLTFLGPDRLTTGWDTPHLWVYRHYWDLVVAGVAWVHLTILPLGIPMNFSIQMAGDELPAFLFWMPFATFLAFVLFFVFLFSTMREKSGVGRNVLSRAAYAEKGEPSLMQMFPPLRASKRLSPLLPVTTEQPAPSVIPQLEDVPSVSPSDVAALDVAGRGTGIPSDLDHFERVLLKSEASLESLRMGLESARRAGVNLVIEPSIAQANADLQELRSSLDEIDLAIEELRGHQHLLMATLISHGDAKRTV